MPYIFNDSVASPPNSSIAILDDANLQGGYRVLATVKQRDELTINSCKVGMLVRCMDVNKLFELFELKVEFNEDDEEVYVLNWREFKLKPDVVVEVPTAKPLTRWALTLRSTSLAPGAQYKLKIPVSKLILVESASVDFPSKIWLKETESALQLGDGAVFNQILEHEFVTGKLTLDSRQYFPDGTKLRSRYTKIFMNKDPNTDKYIYYTIENTSTVTRNITAKFLFVSLQLS